MSGDFASEVRAHGVIGGFGLTVDGTHLAISRGLAYDGGAQVRGAWDIDFASLGAGWWSVGVSQEGALVARGLAEDGLPLCLALTDAAGEVQIIRDIRRQCWPFLWESGDGAQLHMDIPRPFRVRRIQGAVRERCGDRGMGWVCSTVILPPGTALGMVLEGPVWWPLKWGKAAQFGAALVVEGYAL
jgi:hypothetical protein